MSYVSELFKLNSSGWPPTSTEERPIVFSRVQQLRCSQATRWTGRPSVTPETGFWSTGCGVAEWLGVLLYQMTVGDLGKPMAPDWDQDVCEW